MSALDQLRDAIRRDNWVILDTETTGLNIGEIVSIAILNCYGNMIVNTLVKPQQPIPPASTVIHGITDKDVINMPTWLDVQPYIKKVLTGKDVIIYNAAYDRKMMAQSSERWGIKRVDQIIDCQYYCAMNAYAEYNGDWSEYHQSFRWVKLTEAWSTIVRSSDDLIKNAHTALVDCMMVHDICVALDKILPAE